MRSAASVDAGASCSDSDARRQGQENGKAPAVKPARVPWNKDKLVGPKLPLPPGDVWSIRPVWPSTTT